MKGKESDDKQIVNQRTINSTQKIDGMVKLKIKIYNIEAIMNIFIVDKNNFNCDFLIGLDCIKKFKSIHIDLRITQYNPKEDEVNQMSIFLTLQVA